MARGAPAQWIAAVAAVEASSQHHLNDYDGAGGKGDDISLGHKVCFY
jgi:hypothetical protein